LNHLSKRYSANELRTIASMTVVGMSRLLEAATELRLAREQLAEDSREIKAHMTDINAASLLYPLPLHA
jgi:hypothetical protein